MNLTAVIDKVVQISDFKKNPSRFLEEEGLPAKGIPLAEARARRRR